jgi:predicted nucleotidyltransferase
VIRRLIARSARGPLGPVWRAGYEAAIRAIAWSFLALDRRVSVYVAGSIGRGEPVYGFSDLDVLVVAPADPAHPGARRKHLTRHATRIERLVPGPPRSLLELGVCEPDEFRQTVAATVLTRDTPGLLTDPGWRIVAALQERPGVGRPIARWRRVAGPERRPVPPPEDRDRRRLDAWLELQFWWRHAFRASLAPAHPAIAHLCVKLVSEPTRAWLWLERGEAVTTRRDVLRRGIEVLPGEERILRSTLEVERTPDRGPPGFLADSLGFLLRITELAASALDSDAAAAGVRAVELVGGHEDLLVPGESLPEAAVALADWRAVAAPRLPDEALALAPGDPADPVRLAAAARTWRPGILPALRMGRIAVFPSQHYDEGMLRAAACAVTDPVSWALLGGERVARLPQLPGWSADDLARRAVDEHGAWLRKPQPPVRNYLALPDAPPQVLALARLLTAARAGLFADSLAAGEPRLAVAVRAAARCADSASLAEAIERAADALGAWYRDRRPCGDAEVEPLRRALLELNAYRSPTVEAGNGRSEATRNRRS